MTERKFSEKFAGRVVYRLADNLRKVMIICFTVAVLASAWALTRPQRWGAWAAAIVPGSTSSSLAASIGALGIDAGNLPLDLLGSGILGGNGSVDATLAVQVLGSRSVLERIVLEYDLISEYRAVSMEKALEKFQKRIEVSLSAEGVIFISAQGSSRTEAAAIVNDMVTFTNQELSQLVTSRARRSRIQTEAALELALDSLQAARQAMEEFRIRTGLVFPEQQASVMLTSMADIESEMVSTGALLQGISGSLSSRSAVYSQARAQYDYLEEALAIRSAGGDSLGLYPAMDSIPYYLSEYEVLYIELETRNTLYLLLRSELESLKIEEARESPTIEMIVPPSPEYLRSYPKRTVMVITYTGIAFILCLVWITFLTWYDTLLESSDAGPFLRGLGTRVRGQLRLRRGVSEKR